MAIPIRSVGGTLKRAALDFWKDDCPRMAAAISYYTIFSLPPLLLLIIMVAGIFLDPAEVRTAITSQMGALIGPEGREQIREMIANADRPGSGYKAILGGAALIFGATGAFIQLQTALNDVWKVEPDPAKGGIKNFITKRIFSFGLILFVAFMLLISLTLTAALSALGDRVGGGLNETLLEIANFIVSFAVITVLFAAMFKVMPDAEIQWSDVWVGATMTSLLFVIGKFAIGYYLGSSNPGDAFGAAGSLALVLVWIYYAMMILLLGAQFTRAWVEERGHGARPEPGASTVVEEKVKLPNGAPPPAPGTSAERKEVSAKPAGISADGRVLDPKTSRAGDDQTVKNTR
jgi:membrane protein